MNGSLAIQRLQLLIAQRREKGDSQAVIAKALDRTQGWVSHVVQGSIDSVGTDVIERASRAWGVAPHFFTDPLLGPAPHYEEHREIRRDRDSAYYPVVVEYFAELRKMGTPAHTDDETVVLGIRFADGGASLTREKVRAYHRLEREAREDRELAEARGEKVTKREPPPLPEGGKRVDPGKARRR